MGNQIIAWRTLSPSIPRAKRRDPGGLRGIDRSAQPSRTALPDDECERLVQGFHLTSPHQWDIKLSEEGESDTSTTTQRA
jgi:hypothetical protein